MEIVKRKLSELKPYSKNAKLHPQEQIDQIKKSIQDFGFNDPIAIDENNMIIEGHGRYEALKQLGWKEVECIPLLNMTEQQKKAYILVHNKLTMDTDFDFDILNEELKAITDFNMFDFDFDIFDEEEVIVESDRSGAKTDKMFHLDMEQEIDSEDFFQMPEIINNTEGFIPKDVIGFDFMNRYKGNDKKQMAVHFYRDDWTFEKFWKEPEKYIEALSEYGGIIGFDFSMYFDMARPIKIWNTYKNKFLNRFYQQKGIKVIPDVQLSNDEKDYEYSLRGIPKGTPISIEKIGTEKETPDEVFVERVKHIIEIIQPPYILFYGANLEKKEWWKQIEIEKYTYSNDNHKWIELCKHRKGV